MAAAVRVGVVCDLHWAAQPSGWAHWHNPYEFAGLEERVRTAARWFGEDEVDVVAVLGDVSDSGAPADLRAPLELLARAGRPVVVVPGNHDVAMEIDALGEAVREVDGDVRCAPFAAQIGGVDVRATALRSDDRGETARGVLPDPPAGGVSLVLSHYPLISQAERLAAEGFVHPGDLLNRAELERSLTECTIVLHGHLHARLSECRDATLQLGFAALVEYPAEAALVHVEADGNALRVRRETRSLAALAHTRTPVLDRTARWSFASGVWQ
jgi:calcineurin-like phosphoesterase family protein